TLGNLDVDVLADGRLVLIEIEAALEPGLDGIGGPAVVGSHDGVQSGFALILVAGGEIAELAQEGVIAVGGGQADGTDEETGEEDPEDGHAGSEIGESPSWCGERPGGGLAPAPWASPHTMMLEFRITSWGRRSERGSSTHPARGRSCTSRASPDPWTARRS